MKTKEQIERNMEQINFLINWRGWFTKTIHTEKWLLLPNECLYEKSIFYAILEADEKIIYKQPSTRKIAKIVVI